MRKNKANRPQWDSQYILALRRHLGLTQRALADSYGDRVLIGEICLPNDRLARWYGTPDRLQVHLPFNFQLIENAWDAASLRRTIAAYEESLPSFGWPNWVMGSHDAPRIAARVGEAQSSLQLAERDDANRDVVSPVSGRDLFPCSQIRFYSFSVNQIREHVPEPLQKNHDPQSS